MQAREQLSQREIDHVLDGYDIGQVRSISELAAGSVYSPKVIIEADRGKLLLKRRARGLDLPAAVAFSHEVILGALQCGVCVPPLLGTREGNSMVYLEDHVYELFVFIEGVPFDRSPAMINTHAQQAGKLLSELHQALDTISPTFEAPTEPHIIDLSRASALDTLGTVLEPTSRDQCKRILGYGAELAQANAESPAIVHGDWHPGNMIYRETEIIAACDFDNTRSGSRLRELAQAMVHFSLKAPMPGQTARACDPAADTLALQSFWTGYHRSKPKDAHARACVGLMPATMIDEALASLKVHPTDAVPEQAESMLIAVSRKAAWLDEHQSKLISMLESQTQERVPLDNSKSPTSQP